MTRTALVFTGLAAVLVVVSLPVLVHTRSAQQAASSDNPAIGSFLEGPEQRLLSTLEALDDRRRHEVEKLARTLPEQLELIEQRYEETLERLQQLLPPRLEEIEKQLHDHVERFEVTEQRLRAELARLQAAAPRQLELMETSYREALEQLQKTLPKYLAALEQQLEPLWARLEQLRQDREETQQN